MSFALMYAPVQANEFDMPADKRRHSLTDNKHIRGVEATGGELPTHETIIKQYGQGKAGFCQADVSKEIEIQAMVAADADYEALPIHLSS